MEGAFGDKPYVGLSTPPRARSIFTKPGSHPISSASSPWRIISSAHRSEEHTSELQSRFDLVCRLLLEKKKSYQYRQDINRSVGTGRTTCHSHVEQIPRKDHWLHDR